MAIWQVEVDGKVYELEGGNTPPSEQQARQATRQFQPRTKAEYLLPSWATKYQEKPGERTLLGDIFQRPGAAIRSGLLGQGYQRGAITPERVPTFQETLLEKRASRPYGPTPTTTRQELPGMIGASALGMAGDIATNPAMLLSLLAGKAPLGGGRTLGGVTRQTVGQTRPAQALYRFGTKERQLPTGQKFKTDYITQNLLPRAQQFIKTNIEKFTPGIERFAREKLKISQSAINTIKSKGVKTIEATRGRLKDNIDEVSQRITRGIENKRLQADNAYKTAVDNFKGTINASSFRVKLGEILRQRGWIDKTGKPTTRFGAKLDPVLDDLTRLHQDLRAIYKGKAIKGFKIPKEDFITYRDMLGRLLKDRPSDRSIMQLREALYQSAEQSGMKGIVGARNLERVANQVEQNLVKKGLVGERGLGNYHKMTQEQKWALKEIEYYIKDPFIDDLAQLTAARDIDKIYAPISDIPGQGNPIANQLMQATDPRKFNFIKNNLRPFLGNATESIFKDLGAHRFATGIKTAGKYGLGAAGTAAAYSLLRKPVISAIESISGGGGNYGGGQ